jgi:outer membrane protein OmpA-like peptidoglycan-associated protein
MRITRIVLAASALLLVSGCSMDRVHDFKDWYSAKPSRMEKKWGPNTTGYFGQNAAGRAVLHPPGREGATREELNPPRTIDEMPAPAPVDTNSNVTVFPLEEDDSGVMPHHVVEQPLDATTVTEVGPEPAPVTSEPVGGYGKLTNQLFFAHGSARIGSIDHKKLATTAHKLHKRAGASVTVVGHASHRVNGVTDPVRKKEINFEMAQKRANAVTSALTQSGVDPGWVLAVSKGDDEPNPHRGKRSQEAADRRVEVFVNGQ